MVRLSILSSFLAMLDRIHIPHKLLLLHGVSMLRGSSAPHRLFPSSYQTNEDLLRSLRQSFPELRHRKTVPQRLQVLRLAAAALRSGLDVGRCLIATQFGGQGLNVRVFAFSNLLTYVSRNALKYT